MNTKSRHLECSRCCKSNQMNKNKLLCCAGPQKEPHFSTSFSRLRVGRLFRDPLNSRRGEYDIEADDANPPGAGNPRRGRLRLSPCLFPSPPLPYLPLRPTPSFKRLQSKARSTTLFPVPKPALTLDKEMSNWNLIGSQCNAISAVTPNSGCTF